MIGQRKARHTMCTLNVRRLAWEGHLDTCWSPWNKLSQFAFTNSLQRLVNLCGVNFSLWQRQQCYYTVVTLRQAAWSTGTIKNQPPDVYKLYWGYTLQSHGYINSTSPLVCHTWSDNKVREVTIVCLQWWHWTKTLVWFDDIDVSAFHSCVVVDL